MKNMKMLRECVCVWRQYIQNDNNVQLRASRSCPNWKLKSINLLPKRNMWFFYLGRLLQPVQPNQRSVCVLGLVRGASIESTMSSLTSSGFWEAVSEGAMAARRRTENSISLDCIWFCKCGFANVTSRLLITFCFCSWAAWTVLICIHICINICIFINV